MAATSWEMASPLLLRLDAADARAGLVMALMASRDARSRDKKSCVASGRAGDVLLEVGDGISNPNSGAPAGRAGLQGGVAGRKTMGKTAGKRRPAGAGEDSGSKRRRRQDDTMTPKQRQMLIALPAAGETVDTVRTWNKAARKTVAKGARTALPTRSHKGTWKSTAAEEAASQDEDEGANVNAGLSARPKKDSFSAGKSFESIRLDVAQLALVLSESPEASMKKLGELRAYCDLAKVQEHPEAVKIVQLGLLTTLTVMKDLMPGYAIRALSEEEKDTTVSRDVKAVRQHEQSFLGHYKLFLQRLQRYVSDGEEGLRFVANVCICDLLVSAGHFNHYEDVVKWAVHGALGNSPRLGEECCRAIVTAFREDQFGKSTFLAVRAMSDLIKDRHYQVPPRALACFLAATIRTDIAGHLPNAQVVRAPRGKKSLSKRDKKELKRKLGEMQRISDAEALVSKEEQDRWNSESLRYMFRVYFGVIKKRPDSQVMPEVLKGLAHFAHLISGADYFADLLRALKSLTESTAHVLGLEPALQCVLTVARIQALQERALAVDIKFIYTYLFAQLARMASRPKDWLPHPTETIALLREVFKALLGPRLYLSSVRLAAFAQKLADLGLAISDEYATLDVLNLLLGYLEDHRNVSAALLDRECFGQGAYMPDCADPDLCCPFARTICTPLDKIAARPQAKVKSLVGRILALANKHA